MSIDPDKSKAKAETVRLSLRDLGDADGFSTAAFPDYSTRNFVFNIRNNSTSSFTSVPLHLHLHPQHEIARFPFFSSLTFFLADNYVFQNMLRAQTSINILL